MARRLERYHTLCGRSPRAKKPTMPETTGALASVTSVPTATCLCSCKEEGLVCRRRKAMSGEKRPLAAPRERTPYGATASNATPDRNAKRATSRDVALPAQEPRGARRSQSMAGAERAAPPECVVFSCIVLNPEYIPETKSRACTEGKDV